MKGISRALAAPCLLGLLLLTSCDLTEYNPSGVTAETVYTTPEGFETLVSASYAYARWWYGKEEGYSLSEAGTDIWMSGAGDEHPALSDYENLDATEPAINGGGEDGLTSMWAHLYAAINLVNAGITGVEESGLSQDMMTIREAELRFLRAFYYWHIVETWGGVHFTLEPLEGVETTLNRTPVEDFYAQIVEDLEFAVENLPATTPDYGRVTAPAAEAFLARVFVTMGRNQEAIDLAEQVINGYSFALLDNYADLWDMSNLQNSEVIWAVNYAQDSNLNDRRDNILFPTGHFRGGNNLHLMVGAAYYKLGLELTPDREGFFNRWMPTRFLLDLYDKENETRYDATFRTVWYATESDAAEGGPVPGVAPGDTALWTTRQDVSDALEASKAYLIYDRSDIYQEDGSPVQRDYYPSMWKFRDPTRATWQVNPSGRDAFVIRLAEMDLIAAEASLNMGNTAQAAEYINVIRERAAKPGREVEMRISASDVTLDFLLDEWAREFAGEQMRWFILKRNDRLVERVQRYNPGAQNHIQECHLLRPIPQRELDAVENDDEFTQNPGCGY